jgi:hypothetical protein
LPRYAPEKIELAGHGVGNQSVTNRRKNMLGRILVSVIASVIVPARILQSNGRLFSFEHTGALDCTNDVI